MSAGLIGRAGWRSCNLEINQRFSCSASPLLSLPPAPPEYSPSSPKPPLTPTPAPAATQRIPVTATSRNQREPRPEWGLQDVCAKTAKTLTTTGPGWDGSRHTSKLPERGLPPVCLLAPLALSNHNEPSFMEHPSGPGTYADYLI